MSELSKRAVFGLLYVGIMLSAVFIKGVNQYVFSLLAFGAIWEYSSLVGLHRTRPLRTIFDGLAAIYLILVISSGYSILDTFVALTVYCVYLCYIFVRALYDKTNNPILNIAKILLGQVYIAAPLALASSLANSSTDSWFVFTILVCIWANDTGAFIFGSRFGKRRLFPRLSPKKSWEGFLGGVSCSAVVAVVISLWENSFSMDYKFIITTIALGVVVSISATWGDLFESMLKRQAGVKDSGHIIPGHGGILDRIDSLLFAVPMVSLAYLIWLLR